MLADMPEKEGDAGLPQQAREPEMQLNPTEKILQMSEISLWLDHYDDIFSDFDPRPYSQRSLSDDFLAEARKASRDKDQDKLELRLLVANDKRDPKIEAMIRKRLRDHFSKHANQLRADIRKTRNSSIILALLGISMMLAATYIGAFGPATFVANFLFVLLEPAGWFMTWFALDKFFTTTELKNTEYGFYNKMSRCEILFSSY